MVKEKEKDDRQKGELATHKSVKVLESDQTHVKLFAGSALLRCQYSR